jgi:hypothetical protein
MNYGHAVRKMLGWLGDDNSTLEHLGFSQLEINQIVSSFHAGTLSSGGYQAILGGQVGPAQLADFLAANPGAGARVTRSGGNVVAVSDVNAELAPNPAPTVAAPFNLFNWLTESGSIAGVTLPNIAWIGLSAGAVMMLGGHAKRGRHHA